MNLPNKVHLVKEYLQAAGYTNLQVVASVGHIMTLADDRKSYKNSGVYTDNNFELNLKISEDKHKVVNALKDAVKWADKIALCTDPDIEGYVISWSLVKFLKLKKGTYFRAITHEITPKAVVHAIENPVEMNENIIDAGLSRLTIDKLIGWSLSPIVKNYLGCKSVGRCQSIGLKVVADREREINNFISETYFDLYLNFIKNNTIFKAKYIGTDKNKIDHLKNIGEVKLIKSQCDGDYVVKDIEIKEKQESPKPPFCTATLQQECGNKFNLKVKDTMAIAQKLFENGFVTYIRSDSTEFSAEFTEKLKDYINTNYNNTFTTPRVGKKTGDEQEGHECIRVTDLSLTPDKALLKIQNDLQFKVYKLIWQRTVASALPNAKISETIYSIYNNQHKFILTSNELVYEGYRIVYNYKDEQENGELVKETFEKEEKLIDCDLESEMKKTSQPSRFSESSLIKYLQQIGVGRPSTFATIVETLLSESRGYAKLEDKKIVPTERGLQLAAYLDRAFSNIINLNFTRELEEELDKIANGSQTRIEFLTNFFNNLETSITNNRELGLVIDKIQKTCPKCGATLVVKRSRFGKMFYACPNYPNCCYAENIN